MFVPVIVLLAFAVPWIHAVIVDEYNCTDFSQVSWEFIYTPKAVACENAQDEKICEALYPPAEPHAFPDIYPKAGGNAARSFNCYNTIGRAGPVEQEVVEAAIQFCPKTCGFCCMTSAYTCRNSRSPRINCETITPSQCRNVQWRPIIAEDCPAACGFCNQGGCVDIVQTCKDDISICNAIGLQDFVNVNCQRTCNRCAVPTTASPQNPGGCAPGPGNGTCASYDADTSASCETWAANGFCTNDFFTLAQRKSVCATTCKIC